MGQWDNRTAGEREERVGQNRRGEISVAILTVLGWCCAGSAGTTSLKVDRDWFWGDDSQRARQEELIGRPAPRLQVSDWHPHAPTRGQLADKIIVVHFWATWSTASQLSIAQSNRLQRRYRRHGVEVVGICGSGHGQEHMSMLADKHRARFLVARDLAKSSAQAWRVMWWPTYAVVGRDGRLAALGLKGASVGRLIDQILSSEGSLQDAGLGAESATVSARWIEGGAERREQFVTMLNRPAPVLKLQNWINSDAQRLADLEGKVVLLTFLQTRKNPSHRTLRPMEEIFRKYRHRGLVAVGICHRGDAAQIRKQLSTHEVTFPIAVDQAGACFGNYRVNGAPDFYLIDRAGRLRIADCRHDLVIDGIEWLLGE